MEALDNSLPYLSRRAVENKTVMEGREGASIEKKRLSKEIMTTVLSIACSRSSE